MAGVAFFDASSAAPVAHVCVLFPAPGSDSLCQKVVCFHRCVRGPLCAARPRRWRALSYPLFFRRDELLRLATSLRLRMGVLGVVERARLVDPDEGTRKHPQQLALGVKSPTPAASKKGITRRDHTQAPGFGLSRGTGIGRSAAVTVTKAWL